MGLNGIPNILAGEFFNFSCYETAVSSELNQMSGSLVFPVGQHFTVSVLNTVPEVWPLSMFT